jgi:2-polyprenyl-3-methyl-5-hydroxy-6-metoxy-1,4-benzoquinol methylase
MTLDLRSRNLQPELMDDPSLDGVSHEQALTGLRRINWWSRTDLAVWRAIRRNLEGAGLDRPISILDIASGGGDLAIRLSQRAEREGIAVNIEGCDISPTAVGFATRQASAANRENVRFTLCNALQHPLPQAQYDVVMCSLFLHHLTEDDAVVLMGKMQAAARCLVLIDDLQRTRLGYCLAWLGCRLLTRCHVVHVDGPMSVEGALTVNETQKLAERAGIRNAAFETHWPERFIMTSLQSKCPESPVSAEAAYARQ